MRVSRDQVRENRKTILDAAGRLFRERGFDAVTVTDVMKAANLTHGGFYGYFKSKDDLIAQSLAAVLDGPDQSALPQDMDRIIAEYLSPAHRDATASGCPVAALAGDVPRQSEGARDAMICGLRRQIDFLSRIEPVLPPEAARQSAIGTWSAMVGAMILARMSGDDAQLSDEILSQTREWLLAQRPDRDA